MKRAILYIIARFYETRAEAALNRYVALSLKAEVFFSRLGAR